MERLKGRLCEQCQQHDKENFKEKALQSAVTHKHTKCIEELITAGADVNFEHNNRSLLERAAESGSVDNVQILLKAGAEVNPTHNLFSRSALMSAATVGNAQCVDVLLKAGADVNLATEDMDDTALLGAVSAGSVECTKLLIAAGADVNRENMYEGSPIIQAVHYGYTEIVELLLEGRANVNATDYIDGSSPIMTAAWKGYDGVMDVLLKAGANVNRVCKQGTALTSYPLKLAVQCYKNGIETPASHYKHCLEMLIEAGADVNANPDGFSALIVACRSGFDDGVELLIKSGADVNILGDKGLSPLMEAAANGHVRCAELLLEAGVDVNFQNTQGLAALMCVGSESPIFFYDEREMYLREAMAKRDSLGSVQLLLRSGTKINITDRDSRNALQHQVALYNSSTESDDVLQHQVAEQIISTGCDDICLLLFAAGETLDGITDAEIPDCLRFDDIKLNLKHICREAIREHLLKLDPHTHLFGRVPRLGLPSLLTEYLLYNQTLDDHVNSENTDDKSEDSKINDKQ